MSSSKENGIDESKRDFLKGVSAGTAGVAIAGALASLGFGCRTADRVDATTGATPMASAASNTGTTTPIASAAANAGAKEGEVAASPFFQNPPPWPEGVDTHKYDHLFSTSLRENTMLPDIVPGPQAYFRGASDLPGAKINMGWQIFTKEYKLEMEYHYHDTDEYLFFLGSTFPDLVGSFDAEIEYFMGKEHERHIITEATVLYIPAGLEHNPCYIKRVGKPLFFSALQLAPWFNGTYQTMGHMEFKSATKIK